MATHLVQITDGTSRRIALVNEPHLHCLANDFSVFELAQRCLHGSRSLEEVVHAAPRGDVLSYDDVYLGRSPWRLIVPVDVPGSPSSVMVSGTGLTHLGSARQRQEMHLAEEPTRSEAALTDSMRMFQWGVQGGRPSEDRAGVAPEWFYKGDGSVLRAHSEALEVPGYAEDGGEEAELAGIYMVDDDGTPYRIGIVQGNEFSDHVFEKRNYLNLAGSKLRTCSIGPELVIGASFDEVVGRVQIVRSDAVLWHKNIASGEKNMCHSLANIEHHHFKFAAHRQPGNLHVHFLGADALSFGDGVALQNGDITEVAFEGFGRPLRNPISVQTTPTRPVRVKSL